MQTQKGFLVPLVALIVLLAAGGAAYYYHEKHPARVATTAETTSPSYAVAQGEVVNSQVTHSYSTPGSSAPAQANYSIAGSANAALVEKSSAGVLPQRLEWFTYTNIPYSYAISYPTGWTAIGGPDLVTLSDGRANVSVAASNITPGLDLATFAAQNGAAAGTATIKINAYTAIEAHAGADTIYYIVNGSVGYRIVASEAYTSAEAGIMRAMLIEFTVTKQR